jgi:hypothetical protein
VKLLGLWGEISTSMAFVVGALKVTLSRPRVNFVMMRKGDSRHREPRGLPDNNCMVRNQVVCLGHPEISRPRIVQPVSDSTGRSKETYGISYPNSMTIGKTRTMRPSKNETVGGSGHLECPEMS